MEEVRRKKEKVLENAKSDLGHKISLLRMHIDIWLEIES